MGRGPLRNAASHSFLPPAGPHSPAHPQQDIPPSPCPWKNRHKLSRSNALIPEIA